MCIPNLQKALVGKVFKDINAPSLMFSQYVDEEIVHQALSVVIFV